MDLLTSEEVLSGQFWSMRNEQGKMRQEQKKQEETIQDLRDLLQGVFSEIFKTQKMLEQLLVEIQGLRKDMSYGSTSDVHKRL